MEIWSFFPKNRYFGHVISTCIFKWLQQCELSLSKEPCKITVRDELEVSINKYTELARVITEKKDAIEDVIEKGKDLAGKANCRVEFYRDGVELLEKEWTRVTALVDDRRTKLDSWSKSFVEYEEIRGATLRSKEDMETRLAQLESDLIEDVSLEDTSADVKDLHAGIDNVKSASDKVIEEYEILSRAGETDEYITNVSETIDELRNTAKSFEKRIAVIQANKELASKLKDKLDLIDAFLQKASNVIENETVPTNPDELESSIQEHDALLNEFNQLQVRNYDFELYPWKTIGKN